MGSAFLWAVAFLHAGQMAVSAGDHDWPVAMVMLGFTIADLGILWTMKT